MNKLLASTLIASAVLTSVMPTTLWAATTKKVALAAVKKPLPAPVKLLNARVTDEHLYHIFTGELLVSDTGTTKQISIIVGNQVIEARYKMTREDNKEVWSFNISANRNQLFTDDVLTFAVRYKSKGKIVWDYSPKYKLTESANAIFGDTVIKKEKALYDWTFNSVTGTVLVKNVSKGQGVTVTYTTDNWRTRNIVIAKLKDTNKDNGLQRFEFQLPTDMYNVDVQYFVVLNTPQKTYIDNNGGMGYNINR